MDIIDIKKVAWIENTLSSSEIEKLNTVIQSPDIIDFLHNVTNYAKKTRNRIRLIVVVIIAIITFVTYFYTGYYWFISWFISTIVLFSWNGYKHFVNVTEKVSKNMFQVIANSVNSDFYYNYEDSQPFRLDISMLLDHKFLNHFTKSDSFLHQIHLKKQKEENFSMEWYRLKTHRTVSSSSGNGRQLEYTNEHYLVKIQLSQKKFDETIMIYPIKQTGEFLWVAHANSCKTIYEQHEPKVLKIFFLITVLCLYAITIYYSTSLLQYFGATVIFWFLAVFIIWLIKLRKYMTGDPIKIWNTEFNSYYKVFGKDEYSVSKNLTPNLIDTLNRLAKKSWNKYSFMFINDTIYIKRAILRINYLDINIWSNMNENLSEIVRFYTDIREVQVLWNEMNKNFK